MNWRQKKAINPKRAITWKMVEQNKWASKVTEKNYLFVIINPLTDGKYQVTYMDADLNDYDRNEKEFIRLKYNVAPHANRELALRIMEHYGYFEWVETVENRSDLEALILNQTSCNLSILKNLKEDFLTI